MSLETQNDHPILESRQCLICGPEVKAVPRYSGNFSLKDINAEIFSARRAPDRIHFPIQQCPRCGVLFSSPSVRATRLTALYSDGRVTYSTIESQIFRSYSRILDRVTSELAHRDLFVEVGGGPGMMLRYGSENGFHQSIEVEPSREAETIFEQKYRHPEGKHRFIRSTFPTQDLEENSASLVCSFQVLDHSPDPLQFLRDMHRLLRPGGAAVIVTHNTRALSARLLGKRSPIFDIEHVYLFHPQSLSAYLKHAGFTRVRTFAVSNSYPLSYWLHLLPVPKASKGRLERLLRPVANKEITLYAGNMAAIAWKEGH